MRWWRIVGGLLLIILSMAKGWASPPDSVAYHPEGPFYLIYQRNDDGTWLLKQLLTPDEYYRAQARVAMGEGFYRLGKSPKVATNKPKNTLGLKANGYLDLNISQTVIEEDNPQIPVALRRRSYMVVDPQMNIHLRANYTDRLKLDLSYNTQTALVNKRSRLRLRYEGEQYDFIQRLEAGNIRMESRNPLIDSGEELMGVRGDFALGPLTLQVIASRQYAEERRITVHGGHETQQSELRGSDYDFAQHFFLSAYFAEQYNTALQHLPTVSSDLYIERVEVWVSNFSTISSPTTTEPIVAFLGASTQTDALPSTDGFEEKGIELASALRLPSEAYTLQPTLGYISLHAPLSDGQILAVAYTYWYRGKRYQVGDLTSNGKRCRAALLCGKDKTPNAPLDPLMMKNGYSLRGSNHDATNEDLEVQLVYKDPTNGTERTLAERGQTQGNSFLALFGWDNTDSSGTSNAPDGLFDCLENITYQPATNTLFLPIRYPFMDIEIDGYPTYQSLYTKSKRVAKEEREHDIFRIKACTKGSGTKIIHLGQSDIAPNSVRVEANGRRLSEGIDYRIDYATKTISLNTNSKERIDIIIQERERVRRKEKSLIGTELNWSPLPGLNIGGSLLAYWEDSKRKRMRWGEEAIRSTMWGLHTQYSMQSTDAIEWLNNWSGLELRQPLKLNAEIALAQVRSQYNVPRDSSDKIIIEDFEQGSRYIDLTPPSQWRLGWLPSPKIRALMSWFTIDPLLVRPGSKHQPHHLAEDGEQRNHPLVREIKQDEFFTNRTESPLFFQTLETLNLSFYPAERGPYNPQLPTDNSEMWGSIIHPLEIRDLESQRYRYIEFWLLDPYSLDPDSPNGEMLMDIGTIPESILPDGGISYEGAEDRVPTEWGKRATLPPQVYAFDATGKVPMEQQDTGLDGIPSTLEGLLPMYAAFRNTNDPAMDDYHFYLGDDWDEKRASIIERYKYINGMEGNATDKVIQEVQSASTWTPDTEDLNRDRILEEQEAYFRYRIPISKETLSGRFIVAEKQLSTRERWVKIRIPLHDPDETIGNAVSLQNAQSLRLCLTHFSHEAQLRLAQFRIVSTPWTPFTSTIEPTDLRTAQAEVLQLSLEEDADRKPIPYVSPPNVEREITSYQWAMRAEDEQAIALKVDYLAPHQPIAIYQDFTLDLRHYEWLSLWSHLESELPLATGDVELFIRLGQDFTSNYYEYRLPLSPTPLIDYSSISEEQLREKVWQKSNQMAFLLSLLPQIKEEREQKGMEASDLYLVADPKNPKASLGVLGHPTLGDVTSVLIGVRNRSDRPISAEIWFNELGVSGARAIGGTAAIGRVEAEVGELMSLFLSAQYRQAGFGAVNSDSRKSTLDDLYTLSLSSRIEIGMLVPKQWHLIAPLRYTLDVTSSQPYYDPLNSDVRNTLHRPTTFRQEQTIELPNIRWLPPTQDRTKWTSLENIQLRYRLYNLRGFSPEITNELNRHSETEASYTYHTDSSHKGLIRINTLWQRLYTLKEYDKSASTFGTLHSRWDWVRGLQIRQAIHGINITLQSTTQALIYEPFEERFRNHDNAQFVWFSREILRDIMALGTTQRYRGSLDITYSLPAFSSKTLQPLSATLSWQSHYLWQKGITTPLYNIGNRGENRREVDLTSRYHFASLWADPSQALLKDASLHFRHTGGTSLTGLLSGGGKAFGLAFYQRRLEPGILFMLALSDPERTFRQAINRGLITHETSSPQPLTSYWRNELDALITLTPIKGMEITLTWFNSHDHHTSLLPYPQGTPPIERGSIRYSTITRLATTIDQDDFITKHTLISIKNKDLPSLLNTLPNWQISYQLANLSPSLKSVFQSLRLQHAYRGVLEIPNYYLTNEGCEIKSIVANQDYTPLVGIEIKGDKGWFMDEKYNYRTTQTLMTSSQRLLSETQQELYTAFGYEYAFAPLFHSRLSILRASQQKLQLQLHHTYTYTLLHQYLPSDIQKESTAIQGLKSHALQISAEYTLSEAISIRAFYEYLQRKPLVTNYNYPYRQTTYGVLLRLQLASF